MLKLLKFLLVLAGAALLFANIEPYIRVTELIFQGSTGMDVCSPISKFPFVGGVLNAGCGFIGAFILASAGYLVWAIFQLVELLPIANSFNVPFLSGLLAKMQRSPQVAEGECDRDAVKRIKKRHNSIVERSLGALLTFSWIMYVLDLALMSWLYQPLNEIGELNIQALVRVLLGVFGVEVVILAMTLINNIIDPKSIQFPQAEQKPVKEY